jgi:hypothetical protein
MLTRSQRSTRWLGLALCIAGPALAEPIVNYEDLPVKTQTGAPATAEQVRAVIVSAGSTAGT